MECLAISTYNCHRLVWPNDDLLTLLDWALEFRLLIATAQEEIIHGNR